MFVPVSAATSASLRMHARLESWNSTRNATNPDRRRFWKRFGRLATTRLASSSSSSRSTSMSTSTTTSATTTTTTTRGPRDWPWPLPPTSSRPTRLERYGPRLWGLTQPFFPVPAPLSSFSAENRMTVYALPEWEGKKVRQEGTTVIELFLHNPLPPTDELVAHLESIKATLAGEAEARARARAKETAAESPKKVSVRVAHVAVPSSSPEHWAAAADALERLGESWEDGQARKETTLWVPPNFFERGGRLLGFLIKLKSNNIGVGGGSDSENIVEALLRARSRLLERGDAQACFRGDISVTSVIGGGLGLFTEVAFHLRSAKTVLTADSAFCLSPEDAAEAEASGAASPLDSFLARLVGIYGKLGCPVGPALASAPGGQGRQFARDIMRWCDEDEGGGGVENVVSCHLSAPVTDDAAGQLRRVFGFLL